MVDLKYLWRFDAPEIADEGGLEKVIKVLSWVLVATDGEREFAKSGRLALPEPDAKTFVPYEKLTQDVLVDWVENNPDVDPDYEKALLVAEFIKRVPAAPAPRYSEPLPFAAE